LDLVEESIPSDEEKEAVHGVRTEKVGAQATLDSFTPHRWNEKGE
jgi:hypothetical protein